MIANRLGEQEYFFGRKPTAIDALLVGYLTLLLKVGTVTSDTYSAPEVT